MTPSYNSRNKLHGRQAEEGNALFLILIAVALFAALSYAITQSGRGSGNTSREQELLDAAAIMQYAGSIEQTINRLKLAGGCTDDQINFENSVVAGYTNPSAPANKSCHVFDAAGGGLAFQDRPARVAAISGQPAYYVFTGANRIADVGSNTVTSGNELILVLLFTSETLCSELNRSLGLSSTFAADNPNLTQFTGDYSVASGFTPDFYGNLAAFQGKTSACLIADWGGSPMPSYFFYHTLIAR